MKHTLVLTIAMLAACLGAPPGPESGGAGLSDPPTLLRLHGPISPELDVWAVTSVWPRERCPGLEQPKSGEYTGSESLATAPRDFLSRARIEGDQYVLEMPLRWKAGDCQVEAFGVGINVTRRAEGQPSAARIATSLTYSILRIVGDSLKEAGRPLEELGMLSCDESPFRPGELGCHVTSGQVLPGANEDTGISFFHHTAAPALQPDGSLVSDVALGFMGPRDACQFTGCAAACRSGEPGCLTSTCDAARDCQYDQQQVRQTSPLVLSPEVPLTTQSELLLEGEAARPAALADAIVYIDFMAQDHLYVRLIHGTQVYPIDLSGHDSHRGTRERYQVPLDALAAADPGGTWILEVTQFQPFFHGAVVQWGLDLYR